MVKIKLTEEEAKRQIVEQRFDLGYVDHSLSELIEQFGPEARLELDWDYDDVSLVVVTKQEETDEQYEKRVNHILKQKQIAADKAAKKKEKEYKDYLRLKKKFEGKQQ